MITRINTFRRYWWIFVILVVFIVAIVVVESWIHRPSTDYYGVFLTSGQVYFGNIQERNDHHVMLTHVFYIQLKNAGAGQGGASGVDAVTSGSDVSLIKLGNELQGPEDWMDINQTQVIFVEKLKSDSRVLKAIQAYKS